MNKNVDLITYTTPESVGVKSENIERYWVPFTSDFQHRMYSVSKSFVALAIGFLEQDGLLDLDEWRNLSI